VGDAEPKTPYVITIRERATSRIGTLSKCFLTRSNDSVFQLISFAEQLSLRYKTNNSRTH
jgi:hypothetical protein